ncbi:hypothetical protein LIER_19445 [Lithospermum erythrorhizon]|uniref:Uncharacterized protein n=1 Tax=Lithospermum erythrorhizon TaxID=34254 RepID=A0AAV3QHU5_LITER
MGVEEEDWRSPIVKFLTTDELPEDKVKARKLQNRSYKTKQTRKVRHPPHVPQGHRRSEHHHHHRHPHFHLILFPEVFA